MSIVRSLDHPGLMKLLEVHETMLSVFLVMELLEGGELLDLLDDKTCYSESYCAKMLQKILAPLAYLHSRGIMHRDIKPENLILRSKKEFDIVIADFGLAQDLSKKIIHYKCGTPGYCAPEIIESKGQEMKYDQKCDVFSVGCIFYYL
jgi:serine/threonine protein kinase